MYTFDSAYLWIFTCYGAVLYLRGVGVLGRQWRSLIVGWFLSETMCWGFWSRILIKDALFVFVNDQLFMIIYGAHLPSSTMFQFLDEKDDYQNKHQDNSSHRLLMIVSKKFIYPFKYIHQTNSNNHPSLFLLKLLIFLLKTLIKWHFLDHMSYPLTLSMPFPSIVPIIIDPCYFIVHPIKHFKTVNLPYHPLDFPSCNHPS